MDEQSFELTVARLRKISEVISKLDPAMRAEAFSLLKPYISGADPGSRSTIERKPADPEPESAALDFTNAEAFFSGREANKPHEAARLAAAYLYSEYGANSFSYDDIYAVADQAGLTLPERVDMTLGAAKSGGKKLFKSAGRGRLRPTTHGETHMKETYQISKGTRSRS